MGRPRVNASLLRTGFPLALAIAVAISGIGGGLDRTLALWRDALHPRTASGHLVLAEIDARSLAELDHWPWPRSTHARIIDALNRAGASLIAFDVDFSSRSVPREDRALAEAIARSRAPVVLPTFRQSDRLAGAQEIENLPIAPLRPHALLASVTVFADPDGLVRSYPYGVVTAGVPRPSIGALLGGASGHVDDVFPIDSSIDPASVPRISVADLVRGRYGPGSLAGREVLVGATAIEMGDRFALAGRGVLPGALVQLLAAESLAAGTAPFDRGPALPLLLLAVALVAASRARRRKGFILAAGGGAILLLPLALEVAHWGTAPIAPALAGLAAAGLLLGAEQFVRRIREARLTDRRTGLPNAAALEPALTSRTGMLAALRIVNADDVLGVLGADAAAGLVLAAARRAELVSAGPVHLIGDGVLAWIIEGDEAAAQGAVETAAALLRPRVELGSRTIEIACAFGLARLPHPQALGHARLAADRAVAAGTRVELHDASLAEEGDWRLSLPAELSKAIDKGDLWVAYQPKLDIRSGRISAVEALVRWRHPERGEIPPDRFIPILEERGSIAELTRFVLVRTLADRARWAAAGLDVEVAVNISALLPAQDSFVAALEGLLAADPEGRRALILEVTESAAMADPDRAIANLDALVGSGVRLSIDDYGTGQSTLNYLRRLSPSEIKIDKSFVQNIESARSDQAMVRSTIELAHELGCSVVAEGVETAGALALLQAFGCDKAQGWHVGRPMAADALLDFLAERRAA